MNQKKCPVFGKCGGCQYQHDDYQAYLKRQQEWVESKLGDYRPLPIVPMEDPYYYRGKVHAAFRFINRKTVCGLYQEESHRVVEVDDCLIEDRKAQEILKTIRSFARSFKWSVYDEKTGRGLLRQVLLRSAPATGEVLVCLVVTSLVVPGKAKFAKALREKHPEVKTVVLNLNTQTNSMVLGEKEVVVSGYGNITDELLGMKFRISASSFYQVNTRQTAILYELALSAADLSPAVKLLDAYCGVGTMGILAAPRCKEVVGVELNRQAVRDAAANARLNHIRNIRFDAADAAEFIEDYTEPFDRIIVDPPRGGLNERFINAILERPAEKLVYVSCNPHSLAEDLEKLSEGYKVESLQPVDMFPWTGHVETVALLSKLDVDKHIDVEIKLDELDLTSAESKASYAQIKEYILEKFDLKVSTLYIAQIKKKCGIVLREHYNKSKKEKQVIPQCTPEKEEAIMDALRHFKMI